MKIAWDVREIVGQKAGKGYYTLWLLESLMKIDHKNEYFLYSNKDFSLPLPSNFHKIIIPKLPYLRHLWEALDIKRKKIDLLFSTTSYVLPLLVSCKTVVVVHDLAVYHPFTKPQFKTFLIERLTLKKVVKKANKIIVPSFYIKRELERILETPPRKIEVIYEGVRPTKKINKTKITEILRRLEINKKFILFVGTIEPRKNLVNLIKAYKGLPEKIRRNLQLIIVGKKGWGTDEIYQEAEDYKEGVRFLGYLSEEELSTLFQKAEIFIYPSLYEGFGLPVLQAVAAGVPVITSCSGSLPEVVEEAAILVNPQNPREITSAIDKIICHNGLKEDLIKKGLKQAKKFSWEKCARQTLEVFEEVRRES